MAIKYTKYQEQTILNGTTESGMYYFNDEGNSTLIDTYSENPVSIDGTYFVGISYLTIENSYELDGKYTTIYAYNSNSTEVISYYKSIRNDKYIKATFMNDFTSVIIEEVNR